jgi:hypothetical protein
MQLVGRHGGRRGAIGEQLELLANAVLGLATGAIQILIQSARIGQAGMFERGDDKARIGAVQRVLGVSDALSPRLHLIDAATQQNGNLS